MALFTQQKIEDWLHVSSDIAADIDTAINQNTARLQLREWVGKDKYDDIEANKAFGDDEYDRVAMAEALVAFATFLGNRGGIRTSDQGGLVRDIGIINQQQTIRQLLSQGEMEAVQNRLRSQAEDLVSDLRSTESIVWAI